MSQQSIKIVFLIFGLTLMVACVFAQSSGPDPAYYYAVRVKLESYPPYEVSPSVLAEKESIRDAVQSMRIVHLRLRCDLTPDQADATAKDLRSKGFNIVFGDGVRYLFNDDPAVKMSMHTNNSYGTLANVIRTNKLMANACHKYGMKFFLHQTCTMVPASFLEKHPDWATIDIDAGKTLINSYGTANTCFVNDDFMAEFYKRLGRLMKESGADGIQQDEIQFFNSTMCGCRWCREKFHKATGYELPPDKARLWKWLKPGNKEYQAWLAWRRAQLVNRLQEVGRILKQSNPKAEVSNYVCNNTHWWCNTGAAIVINDFPAYADYIGYECEPPRFDYLHYWPLNIVELKYLRAVAERMNTSMWTLFYPKRNSDYTWVWFVGMSQGSHHWWWQYAKQSLWTPIVAWEANHANLLRNLKSAANIGVLYSLDSKFHAPGCELTGCFMRTCYALTDNHIPYKVIVDEDMTADQLGKKVNTLILPDAGAMSGSQVSAVRAFVKNGGTVIAYASSSLYDESGARRPDFGLSDVFGFSFDDEVKKTECRFSIPSQNDVSGSITGDFTPLDYCVKIKNLAPGARVLGQITLPDGSNCPGMVVNTYGKGRVVYFSGRIANKYGFFCFDYSDKCGQQIIPGQSWTDNRDQKYGSLIAAAAAFNNPSIPMIVKNVPVGVVTEIYQHKDGDARGIEVDMANLLGGVTKSGMVCPASDISYPDVKANLPDPSKPITISVKASGVRKVYLISPDFEGAVSLPFKENGGRVTVNLSGFARYAKLYFSQGGDKGIIQACEGKILKTIPKPKELVGEVKPALAGSYDPKSAIAFADTASFVGGHIPDAWYRAEPTRFAYGSESNKSKITVTLNLGSIPANPVLEVAAMSDNHPESVVPIEIKLNGESLFKGASTYPRDAWGVQSFDIKPETLRQGANTVEISNNGDGPLGNIPWLGVSFVRLKSKAQ